MQTTPFSFRTWIIVMGCSKAMLHISALTFLLSCIAASTCAQIPTGPEKVPDIASATPADRIAEKIGKVIDQYKELKTRLDKATADLEKTQNAIVALEAQINQIIDFQTKQQMQLLEAELQSYQRKFALSALLANPTNNTSQAWRNMIDQSRLQSAQAFANMNALVNQNNIQQLNTAAQNAIQNCLQKKNEACKLQYEVFELQTQLMCFMERYWSFSDPERNFNSSEVNRAIEAFAQCHEEDYAALIVKALLLERAGRIQDGLEIINEVLQEPPGLHSFAKTTKEFLRPIALATRALLLSAVDRNKDAERSMNKAFNLHSNNPYVCWIKATIMADQAKWEIASSNLQTVLKVDPKQAAAYRRLALILAQKAVERNAKSPDAVKKAENAMKQEPEPSWYSHLVLAVAQASEKKSDEALKSVKNAEAKANGDEENREWCKQLRETLERGERIRWEFDRRLTDPK